MKKAWILSYPLSAQRRPWSDWADAQADLSLRWAHIHFVGFGMRRLISALSSPSEVITMLSNGSEIRDKQGTGTSKTQHETTRQISYFWGLILALLCRGQSHDRIWNQLPPVGKSTRLRAVNKFWLERNMASESKLWKTNLQAIDVETDEILRQRR